MITPTVRAALGVFQQAANRGTAVYLSPELVQELRTALNAEPEGEELPPDYIDREHTGQDRELLEVFYRACNAEGGTADEIHLRGLKAVLAARPVTPPTPETPAEALARKWGLQDRLPASHPCRPPVVGAGSRNG